MYRNLFYLASLILSVTFSTLTLATTLKVATLSPDGSSWMKTMKQAAKEIEKKTDQRVKFKFYPGGVMGNDQAVLRRIRARQLQGGAITSSSLANRYNGAQLYTLPMLFNNQQEVDKVREQMDAELIKGYEKNGFVVFGFAGGGFAYLMSKKPLTSLKEIRESKVWIPNNDPSAKEIVDSMQISPIPLSLGDVYPSLQTGIVDTIATSPIAAIALQWHTQIKYYIDLPILYIYAFMAVDSKAFKKLPKTDQAIVREVMTTAFRKIDENNKLENQQALEALSAFGIQKLKPSPALIEEWKQKAALVAPAMIEEGRLDPQLYQRATEILKSLRTRSNQ